MRCSLVSAKIIIYDVKNQREKDYARNKDGISNDTCNPIGICYNTLGVYCVINKVDLL